MDAAQPELEKLCKDVNREKIESLLDLSIRYTRNSVYKDDILSQIHDFTLDE
jgi:hypothetical protein